MIYIHHEIITPSLVNNHHLIQIQKKTNRKEHFSCDENSGFTVLTTFIYNIEIAVLIIYIVSYITSLVLIYLETRYLYLLTVFMQFPLPLTPASDKHKLDIFFYEFVQLFLKYNWDTTLCQFLVHNIVIHYLYTCKYDHNYQSTCYLLPYEVISQLLTSSHTVYFLSVAHLFCN